MNPPDPNPDDPIDNPELAALERHLARLVPAAPKESTRRRIGRHLEMLAGERRDKRSFWRRAAPLAAAATVMLFAGLHLKRLGSSPAPVAEQTPALPETSRVFVSPPPIETGIPRENFRPVSSQEFLRQTSTGDVVEYGERGLPAREIRMEYDDAWHWHDPATRTNIRIFRPREEVILVPIGTD